MRLSSREQEGEGAIDSSLLRNRHCSHCNICSSLSFISNTFYYFVTAVGTHVCTSAIALMATSVAYCYSLCMHFIIPLLRLVHTPAPPTRFLSRPVVYQVLLLGITIDSAFARRCSIFLSARYNSAALLTGLSFSTTTSL